MFHVGDSPHGAYMVMELVEGQTLASVVAAGPMPTERACRIGKEIAQALDHAHTHGIAHRDLKCANVMLTREGRVKVLDFGIASVLPGANLEHSLTAAWSDDVGHIGGTLPYMAPEVLRGDASSVSSDVWALGVVLYEMTTWRRPFDRQAPSDLVAAILRDSPASMPSDVPPPIAHLIARCLSKDPAERPARAGDRAGPGDCVGVDTTCGHQNHGRGGSAALVPDGALPPRSPESLRRWRVGMAWVAASTDARPAGAIRQPITGDDLTRRRGVPILGATGPDARVLVQSCWRERVLVDLSGRRGGLGDHGTPTEGQFIYYTWNDDLADVWVMDAVPEAP